MNSLARESWLPLNYEASLASVRRVRDEPPARPTIAGWLYPGSTASVYGEPDAGKSLFAAASAQRVVHDGGRVLWLDFEMGERRVIERLLALGLTDVELAAGVLRVHWPSGPPPQSFFAAMPHDIALVVVDSFTGLLSAFDGSSNADTDIERVYSDLLRPLAVRGACVLTLDHVVKRKDEQGRGAVGSQRKLGAPDVAYAFQPVQRFRPGKGGRARLKVARDRAGGLDEIVFTLAPDMSWRISPGAECIDGREFRPTGFMERISIYLETQADPVSRASIEKHVPGGNPKKRIAIAVLADEGYISTEQGSRGAIRHASLRPYREAGDPLLASSPDLAASSPRRAAMPDVATSPTLRTRRGEAAKSHRPRQSARDTVTSPDAEQRETQ